MSPDTIEIIVSLPTDLIDEIEKLVTSGAYASGSEVVRNGLHALFARDEAVENWLRNEVMASVDEMRADPTRALTPEEMRAELTRWHSELTARPSS